MALIEAETLKRLLDANGQSFEIVSLVSQDGFDGDTVIIYSEHDEYHYKRVRDAPEISGWPRVKDQGCQLDSADGLTLTCGTKTVRVDQEGTPK
ncbi:hypothetical protein [Arthrobacter sp.]|uniref:hypothetical protein n=1 Tax=Arthrobacter sp. TaxID=1667 RepID=UPI0028126C65|nr:hypothetical protein [Arthrobacter sp.]